MEKLKLEMDECEITGLTAAQSGLGLHLHHVVLRSQGGDDVRENVLCITGDIHNAYHRGAKTARDSVARHVFKNRPDTWSYLAEKLGDGGRIEWFWDHLL
jgi:hypothetical protein